MLGLNTYPDDPGYGSNDYGGYTGFTGDTGYYNTTASGVSPYQGKLTKKEIKELRKAKALHIKNMRAEEKRRREEWEKKTLADLPNYKKEIIMKHLNREYLEYKIERGCRTVFSGFKWLLVLLGLAILMNFSSVLGIIKTVVSPSGQ